MAQTMKKTANERAQQRRFDRRFAVVRELTASICELWLRARREGWTHERMLTWRTEHVFNHPGYQQLPWRDKTQLGGVWDACQFLAYRECHLVFCYPHPHTGEVWECTRLTEAGLAHELHTSGCAERGGFYWRREDGTFTHQWS